MSSRISYTVACDGIALLLEYMCESNFMYVFICHGNLGYFQFLLALLMKLDTQIIQDVACNYFG